MFLFKTNTPTVFEIESLIQDAIKENDKENFPKCLQSIVEIAKLMGELYPEERLEKDKKIKVKRYLKDLVISVDHMINDPIDALEIQSSLEKPNILQNKYKVPINKALESIRLSLNSLEDFRKYYYKAMNIGLLQILVGADRIVNASLGNIWEINGKTFGKVYSSPAMLQPLKEFQKRFKKF